MSNRKPVRTMLKLLLVLLLAGSTLGLVPSCSSTPLPVGIESSDGLGRPLYARLEGTYYNPKVHTLHVRLGRPPVVEMDGQHFEVRIDSSDAQLDWATNEIVRLIQLHTPQHQWGKLDVGAFYDREWR